MEAEELDEQDEQDMSNEIRRQYKHDKDMELEAANKRNLINQTDHSQQSNQSPPKQRRRHHILPDRSEPETDSDNESNTNQRRQPKSYLHSTLVDNPESTPSRSSHQESQDAKTVPETPDNLIIFTRYNSEQPKKSKSSHPESIQKLKHAMSTTKGIGGNHE